MLLLGQADTGGNPFGLVLVVLLGLALYFLPAVIAYRRDAPNKNSILIVNIFLGWSFLGWVVALAMAFRDQPQPMRRVEKEPDSNATPVTPPQDAFDCMQCGEEIPGSASSCPNCGWTWT